MVLQPASVARALVVKLAAPLIFSSKGQTREPQNVARWMTREVHNVLDELNHYGRRGMGRMAAALKSKAYVLDKCLVS